MSKIRTPSSQQRVDVVYGEQMPLWYARLTSLAFFLAMALVAARAIAVEHVRDAQAVAVGVTLPARALGPAGGLVLDLLLCVPALLVLLRRVLDRTYVLRWNISHALLGALALWAMISVAWSADKFLAAVTASHLLGAAVLLWSMTQLVRSWLRLRWVAATCAALLLVYVAHGIYYQYIDHPDTVAYWERNRAQELAARGWEEGSFAARQFELKLRSGEMVGFNVSANTYATMLVVLSIVAVGVIVQRIRDRDQWGWPVVIAIGIALAPWMGYYTGSRTAIVSSIIAAMMLAGAALLGRWLVAHRTMAFIVALAGVLLGAVALIGHGLYHDRLPGDSLTFRWHYWSGSWSLFEQHPWLGVGWSNFGPHYLAHRLPIASEEIKDPHNLFVRVMVELGLIGLLLAVAWLVRLGWELTRPLQPLPPPANPALDARRSQQRTLWAIFAAAALAIIINTLASVDFTADGYYVFLELFRRALYFALLLIGYAAVMFLSTERPRLDDRPAPWVLHAMIIALAIFMLHNMVDFAFAETGPLLVFAMVAGSVLGVRAPSVAERMRRQGLAVTALVIALLAWLAAAVFVVPIVESENLAHRGDVEISRGRPQYGAALLQQAFATCPVPNADYAFRAALAMLMANQPPHQVELMLGQAIATNPLETQYLLTRIRFEMQKPPAQRNENQLRHDLQQAVALNPHDVQTRLVFAEAMELLDRPADARAQYETALEKNDLLHPDNPRRLAPERVEEIHRKIAELSPTQP